MADPRARYFRKLRRVRRAARRWSVLAGGFGGAAAVLTPYAGIGLADAAWAAAAGSSLTLALWRWSDLRGLTAQAPPSAPDPTLAADQARARLLATVRRVPAGRAAIDELRRQHARFILRGSAAAGPWARLDRASLTLTGLAGRLSGPAEPAALEAAIAERSLRDLAQRVASVEKALRFAPVDARPDLERAHRTLVDQLDGGVTAYERLVAAAASYIAEDGRSASEHPAVSRLTEASDLLHGVAAGLAELRGECTHPLHTPT
ncbi:hypothetical protein [Micromonospora sp. NPDC049679]|uniref:phage shock envelope stress response protein PspM n=1 Tax=Micromonospora sp. NPDC049679 TaxID=3155920 RepID=UPI0033D5AA55